jgi:CHAT domain-containing protein
MQNSARSNPLGEARALEGIAAALAEQGDDDGALEYYRSALDLITEDIGGGAPRVARTYNLLALHLMHMGDLAGAERHQLRAVYIADSVFGHYSPHVAKHLLDLAAIWDAQNRLAEAEALYREALAIRRTWLPDDHTSIAECKADLANFYLNHGDQRQGLPLALEAAEISMKNLREFAPVVSERDALIYSQTMHESVNRFLSSYCAAGGKGVGIEDAVDLILNGTGEVSDAIIERRHLLSQPMDSTATRLWNSYRAARLVLSDLYVGGPDGPDDERFKPVTDSLTKVIAEREAELAKHIDRYRQTKKYARIDHQQVASLLPDSSVLIEYLRHDDESADMPDPARAHYLAAVIGSDGSLEIVPLGAAETIDRLADDYRSHMAHAAALGHLPTADDFAEYQPIARGLYDQLVKPVAHAIADKDLLFISPDAQLNWVSFAALIDDSSRFLIESHPIHYLSGGRDLVRLQTKDPRGSGLLALGNPAFDTTSQAGDPLSQTGANPASPTAPLNPRSNCGQLKNLKLSPLPQTRSEIERVVRVWQDETGEPFDTLLGADATEERFKQVATGRRVVHLSTHAFYLEGACGGGDSDEAGAEDQEHGTATDTDRLVATQRRRSFDDEESQMTEDPLVQSGLFLAGCVSARKSQPDPLVRTLDQSRTEEDGVLTAAEIAGMNLIGTQLVVLSACETGLGRLYQGEGVYGLRRAFQIAGARTVLSTLWPIADELTAPMLPTIYRNGNPASSGKASTDPLPYRLRKSQLDWIDTLRTRGLAPHPYSWGAFVAQGDWR